MKKLMGNLTLSLTYYMLNIVTNFWITSTIISSLGKEAYSFYPLANNICGWMIIISNAINAMLARHISVAISKGDVNKANEYYSTAMLADAIVGLILLIPIAIISLFPQMIFNVPFELYHEVKILFFTVLLTVPLDMVLTVSSVTWTAKDKLHLSYIGRTIQCVVKSLIILISYYCGFIKLRHIGYAIIISDIVYSCFIIWVKNRYMAEVGFNLKYFQIKRLKSIISSGIWSSLMQLGNSLLLQFDLIISNVLLGVSAAGTISIVTTVPNAITSIVTMLGTIFLPSYYKDYASNQRNVRLVRDIQQAQLLVSGIIGTGIVIFLSFGKPFFDLWVPANNSELLVSLSFFYLIPLTISSMFRPVGNACIAYNKMKFQAIAMVINGLLNVLIMCVAIRYTNIGLYAVVMSTCLISSAWHGIGIPIYVGKLTGTKPAQFYKVPLIVCVQIFFTVIVCRIINNYLCIDSWMMLILACGISVVICFGLLVLVSSILKNELKRRIENNERNHNCDCFF